MHASVIDGQIVATGSLPAAARRLDTGQWVLNLADAPVEIREACGWYDVVDVERPPDTDTTTFDRTVEIVDGVPTVVWTERAKTDDELNPPTDPVAALQAQIDALLDALGGA